MKAQLLQSVLFVTVAVTCMAGCSTSGTVTGKKMQTIHAEDPFRLNVANVYSTISTPKNAQADLEKSFDRYYRSKDSSVQMLLNCDCLVGQRSRSFVLWSTAWYEVVLTCDVSIADATWTIQTKGTHRIVTGLGTTVGVLAGAGGAIAGLGEASIAFPAAGVVFDVATSASVNDDDALQKALDAAVDALFGYYR